MTRERAMNDWTLDPAHPGVHALRRLQAGELAGAARADVESHVAGCDACAGRLRALDTHAAAFLARRPPAAFAAAVEARRPRGFVAWLRGGWPRPVALGAFATAAVALTVVSLTPTAPTTRLKTAFELGFHVKHGEQVSEGQPGSTYQRGDALQLRYSTPDEGQLVVISLDGRGAVTPFYDEAGHGVPVEPGVRRLLEGSVILDDAPGPERVLGCFSATPLTTDEVLAAGRRALAAAGGDPRRVDRLDLPCAQAGFTIEKAHE